MTNYTLPKIYPLMFNLIKWWCLTNSKNIVNFFHISELITKNIDIRTK